MKTIEDVEVFMLKHGENIVDSLGEQVDRIETILKVRQYAFHLHVPYKNEIHRLSLQVKFYMLEKG